MTINTQQHNEWWIYALVAFGYTIIVRVLSTDPIFSKRNARSISYVIRAHLVFLGITLGPTWLAIHLYPLMPDWMTRINRRGSFFLLLCFGVAFLLAAIEKQGIYVESKTYDPGPEESDTEDVDADENPS